MPAVLNACRRHSDSPPSPSGQILRRSAAVLNACRRHSDFHTRQTLPARCLRVVCSTPVGVKGFSTSARRMLHRHLAAGAQRLSASKDFPHDRSLLREARTATVLNACRRHRILHANTMAYDRDALDLCSTPVGVKGISTGREGMTGGTAR